MSSQKENSSPAVVYVNTTQEFKQVLYHFGPTIPPHVAAGMAKVSNQRIQNMIRQGKFTRLVIFGGVYISLLEFEKWIASPRKRGRPRKSEPATNSAEKKAMKETPKEKEENVINLQLFPTKTERHDSERSQ